ncbi:hypothetical protein [Nostoc punctiforme]|nr:hypothetical protein [Nostoc punctiforme]
MKVEWRSLKDILPFWCDRFDAYESYIDIVVLCSCQIRPNR